jgi:diguanylate cyclase (GGDEF)-like protein
VSEIAHLSLRVLEMLYDAGQDGDAFLTFVQSIRDVLAFDQAVLLEEAGDGWQCAAALPRELRELRWLPGSAFDEVAAGRTWATCGSQDLPEWKEASQVFAAAAAPALYLPMPVHSRRGPLILLRIPGKDAFGDADLALARQFALLALTASAARGARKMQSELTLLRSGVDALRASASDLARRAYSDELTGLANRARIQERVDDILRAGAAPSFALAFIDLDNFKHINDYYNHAVGDALLVRVARRIAELVRETDVLARISGDEFLLLIHPVDGDDHVRSVVENLLETLKQPFHVEGFEIFTSASIGVSTHPEHGRSYEELRRNADSAMYRAKSGAKGAAAFYDAAVGQAISARMELEQRLRLAIRDRRFSCAFQPKVDIRNQEVVGFETLVRWRDHDGEIHSPHAFIGLATELGVIDPITHFVLAEAIKSIDLLDDAFGAGKAIAVNVAARQAGDPRFMRSFVDALEASGYADRFIVEVTEDAFIATNQFQMHVLPMLRNVGARVSIDDFGTGYSSLSVLADITADEIKIDRSFITDVHRRPRSQSIKAIESVSCALGMSVVAEGVESFEDLAYLLGATRIRLAQGYHFAKPFFLEEIVKTSGARGDERVIAMERRWPERRPAAARAAAGMRRD